MEIKAKKYEELKQMRDELELKKKEADIIYLFLFLGWVSLSVSFLFYVNFPQAFWTILVIETIYLAISTGLSVRTIRNIK
tara:strand:- start:182 stop:421 length:240 start_codon:yes stop_codon:yes gene_type:complete